MHIIRYLLLLSTLQEDNPLGFCRRYIIYLINKHSQIDMDYPVFNPERYSAATNPKLPIPNNYSHTSNQQYISPSSYVSKVNHTFKDETVKKDSRIQYVPFEKKVIDYVDEKKYKIVPKKTKLTDYKDHVSVEMVPKEITVNDYYAVQYIRCYVPEIIPQRTIQHIPVERKAIKYQYVPVERQIVHYPKHAHDQEQPRYLGVREDSNPATKYENMSEQDLQYWQRQYGYRRGEPISVLNQKIRQKYERDKQLFFKQFENSNVSTASHMTSSPYQRPIPLNQRVTPGIAMTQSLHPHQRIQKK